MFLKIGVKMKIYIWVSFISLFFIFLIIGCGSNIQSPEAQATIGASVYETVNARFDSKMAEFEEAQTRIYEEQVAEKNLEATLDAFDFKVNTIGSIMTEAIETEVSKSTVGNLSLEATVEAIQAEVDGIYATQTTESIISGTVSALEASIRQTVEANVLDETESMNDNLSATVDAVDLRVDDIYATLTAQPPITSNSILSDTVSITEIVSNTVIITETLETFPIFVGQTLASGFDMGVDTSGEQRDWVRTMDGEICMDYPPSQEWGAVFITVGPQAPEGSRMSKDFSMYQTLSLELSGDEGGESVHIGLKDSTDADNGQETKMPFTNLSTEWVEYKIPLNVFTTANLSDLYIVTEFVFEPSTPPETVCFRNIQYLP